MTSPHAICLRSISEALPDFDALMQAGGPSQIDVKGHPRDLVTEIDRLMEARIIGSLRAQGASHWVGEESAPKDSDHAAWQGAMARDGFWIDPIDGTTNFAHGIPLYGLCVGYRERGLDVAGTIALPALRELYFTESQEHAFLNGRRLRLPQGPGELSGSLLALTLAAQTSPDESHKHHELLRELNAASRGVLRLGSASVCLAYAASGKIQAVVGFGFKLWDVLVGFAFICVVGGVVIVKVSLFDCLDWIDYVVG